MGSPSAPPKDHTVLPGAHAPAKVPCLVDFLGQREYPQRLTAGIKLVLGNTLAMRPWWLWRWRPAASLCAALSTLLLGQRWLVPLWEKGALKVWKHLLHGEPRIQTWVCLSALRILEGSVWVTLFGGHEPFFLGLSP